MRADDARTANWGCSDTVTESALDVDSGQKNTLPHRGLEPVSVLRLAFQSDALPTELTDGNVVVIPLWGHPVYMQLLYRVRQMHSIV